MLTHSAYCGLVREHDRGAGAGDAILDQLKIVILSEAKDLLFAGPNHIPRLPFQAEPSPTLVVEG